MPIKAAGSQTRHRAIEALVSGPENAREETILAWNMFRVGKTSIRDNFQLLLLRQVCRGSRARSADQTGESHARLSACSCVCVCVCSRAGITMMIELIQLLSERSLDDLILALSELFPREPGRRVGEREIAEIGRAHVRTPVTRGSRMPSSA